MVHATPPEACSRGPVFREVSPPRGTGGRGGGKGGSSIITLALRTPERLRLGPDLAPGKVRLHGSYQRGQRPPSLGQAEARPKRKRQGTIRYSKTSIIR